MEIVWSKRVRLKLISQLQDKYLNQYIFIGGWVKSIRVSKNCIFVMLNDGSELKDFQLIVDVKSTDVFAKTETVLTGTSLWVKGKVVAGQGKQPLEMHVEELEIIGGVPDDYPLQKKSTSLEFLRDVAHVRARTNTFGAVFRLRHEMAMATHQFFSARGLFYIHTPIISSSDCEGAGELFRVTTFDPAHPISKLPSGMVDYSKDYFGTPTFLAVSGQLEGEALALSLGGVYTFGPTFRSENSHTSRHLSEFWMIEPEVAFAGLNEVAILAADYIKHLINHAFLHCREELAFFEQHYKNDLTTVLEQVRNSEFRKITYTEAVDILKDCGKKFEHPVSWGLDLQSEHERFLTDEYFQSPVIVTHYPKEIKAFYMRVEDDNKTVRAMDVLVPGVGEIIGGSEREIRPNILSERMQGVGLKEEDYSWYMDLRRFGSVPHAGFGLGFERVIMYISGMSNIRDVIPFPRFPKSAKF